MRLGERLGAACTTTRGERIARGAVALVLASAAVSLWPSTVPGAIAAGLGALLLAVMAITGFCPSQLLRARPEPELPAPLREHGVVDGRGTLDLR